MTQSEKNEKSAKPNARKSLSGRKKATSKGSLQVLIPRNVEKYYHRTLVDGEKDIPTLKKAFKERPHGYPQNVLLIGPTGAGKTHAVKKTAEELGIPMIRVNLNRMTTVEDFVGQWVPAENGGFRWQDGVLPRLMKNGGVIMVDEINAAPPEILFVLHSVLDFREITLTQKDGEVIKANPDFWFIGAMNPDYYGTERLNEALKDRFEVTLRYPYQREIERKLIKNGNLLEAAAKLRKMFHSPTEEIRTPISTRTLIQFEENERIYGKKLAIEMMANKFDSEERRAVKEVLELHLRGNENGN